MSLEVAAVSSAVAAVGEKTAETAIAAKGVEGVAASAGLASKIGAVVEKSVKGLPKALVKSAAAETVAKITEEIDSSIGDAAEIAGSVYSIANSPSVITGIGNIALDMVSAVAKDDDELGVFAKATRYAKSTISCLNVKFEMISEKAKEGIIEANKIKDAKEGESLTDSLEPNATVEIGGRMYDTDDNGTVYKVDGYELLPNKEYVIDGVTYTTDDQARITSFKGITKKMPDGERDNIAQVLAGGADRKAGDQGGHILARVLGGAKGIENMLAMRGTAINQSVYKRMENEIGRALDDGKEVGINGNIDYKGDSQRPSKITVAYSIDGKERVIQFDNDEGSTELLSSLEKKIDETDFNDLNQEILDAKEDGITISIVSVKTIYDESGKAEKIIVTMRDESSEHPVNEDRVFNLKEVE